MAVNLEQEDFKKLVQILAKVPQFGLPQGQYNLVAGALEGAPQGDRILIQTVFGGDALSVAVNVVQKLAKFGRVTPDQEALGILINHLLIYIGGAEKDAEFLRGLIVKYSMDRPVARTQDINAWKETPKEGALREERIIGENTLRDIRILQLAVNAGRGVLLVVTPLQKGSGFLVADDLLMTNHHILRDQPEAEASEYRFNYQLNLDKQLDTVSMATGLAKPGGLFYTDEDLDYTVVELKPAPKEAKALALNLRRHVPKENERVTIIQHPFGHFKKFSMQNNFVSHFSPPWLRYTTSTEEGSSGSPVFNDEFEVIALHHGAREFNDPSASQPYYRNEGASMSAILDHLKDNAPQIYQRLAIKS